VDPRIIVLDTTAGHIVNAQTLVTWLVQYMKSADVSKHPVHRLHTHRLGGYYLQSEKKPEESQVSKVMMLPLASREGSFPGFRHAAQCFGVRVHGKQGKLEESPVSKAVLSFSFATSFRPPTPPLSSALRVCVGLLGQDGMS
jgi:hypothetical protein